MKVCPTCNRTYSDDTFTFCLNDGALLSAPYDPQATIIIPYRQTVQPPLENTSPHSLPSNTELPDTVPAQPLLARMVKRPEMTEPAEVGGVSGATIVTMVLLIFGSIVLAVFISRC